MTGFGRGEASLPNKKITVEIRSLNSKQLDLSVRMPSAYRQMEYEIRSAVQRAMQRGKVDISINVESAAAESTGRIDREMFKAYLQQTLDALSYSGIDADYDAIVPSVLRMPGVISVDTETISEEETKALTAAVDDALASIDAFRRQEGEILIKDLLERVDKIEHYKEEVTPYEQARSENIKNRIRENLAKLPVEVDNNRLEQEMIFYIEKLDITEEKVRLSNHCRYFREVAASEEGVGRKLGFIAQEMGREINTLGSKANESMMQILVVKMKDELEKIKEQVLNIL
ncbi:MAG: YicC family protein [Alistipes sp.]|nr:YicC family protein [Alistipes sp.]MDE6861507.1 YicC family protein [Alistipes sp.]MDE7130050.1 YicC family protein [Alistipes sp.]